MMTGASSANNDPKKQQQVRELLFNHAILRYKSAKQVRAVGITSLDLSKIQSHGFYLPYAGFLADSLKGTNITELNLSNNDIDFEYLINFMSGMPPELSSLNISNNDLNNDDIKSIAQFVKHTNLTEINIDGCDINADSRRVLKAALEENRRRLASNPILSFVIPRLLASAKLYFQSLVVIPFKLIVDLALNAIPFLAPSSRNSLPKSYGGLAFLNRKLSGSIIVSVLSMAALFTAGFGVAVAAMTGAGTWLGMELFGMVREIRAGQLEDTNFKSPDPFHDYDYEKAGKKFEKSWTEGLQAFSFLESYAPGWSKASESFQIGRAKALQKKSYLEIQQTVDEIKTSRSQLRTQR